MAVMKQKWEVNLENVTFVKRRSPCWIPEKSGFTQPKPDVANVNSGLCDRANPSIIDIDLLSDR